MKIKPTVDAVMLALYTCSLLLIVPFGLSSVIPEKVHKFLAVPQTQQEVLVFSNVTINCTTTDAKANTSLYFRRSPKKSTWKLLKPGVDKIVQEGSQVFTLIKAGRSNTGHYQCRAWKGVNGTVISWPDHAGKIIVTRLKHGSKKPSNKKTKNKKTQSKKLGKNSRPDSGKKTNNKRPHRKRPGNKKSGHKKPGSKKGNKKKRPNSKRNRKKKPPPKKSGKKGSGSKKLNKKSGSKKSKPRFLLKSRRKVIHATEGREAVLNCVAKMKPSRITPRRDMITINWYKDGKAISRPLPSHLSIAVKNKLPKRKYVSILKIKGFQNARDQGPYQCKIMVIKNGKRRLSAPLTIRVKSS